MTMDSANRRRNLGFFFDDAVARVPDKVAIIDLFGGRERCATYRQLDQRMDGVGEHAGAARGASGRARRHADRQPHRVHRILLRRDARRRDPASAQHAARRRHARAHHRRRGLRARGRGPVEQSRRARDRPAAAAAPPAPARPATRRAFSSFEEEMAKPGAAVEPPPIADDAQAFQPYTSGSTGRPKGAIMTHHGMLWYVAYNQRYWPSAESDRGLVALPLFHKNALRGTVKPMLYAGGSFVLMPAYEPRAYLDALGEVQVHLFARGRGGVHDVSPASRLSADARSQRAARHDDRIGGGDAGASGCGRARASAYQGLGKLRVDRGRQPAARADRRPAGAARQPRRAGARDRAPADRCARATTPTKASC